MNISYGVSFGKKSLTVTRDGGTVEEATEKANPENSFVLPDVQPDVHYKYPVCVYGHASRTDLKEATSEQENVTSKKRVWSESRQTQDFEHLFTSDFTDDLPHPSKLRKASVKKQAKRNQLIEKFMCVDNHLHQLRQRNNKYKLYKSEEEIKPSPSSEQTLSAETPDYLPGNDTPKGSFRQQTPSTVSFQIPDAEFPSMKKPIKSKHHLCPPGSILASVSLEQEEEDKWFQQLWRPQNKSRNTEE